MIDMKMKPQSPATLLSDVDDAAYPVGLAIRIEGEQLKALGIGEGNLPQVGQRLQLTAMGEVVQVEKESGSVESGYCVRLQIQQLALGNEQQQAAQQVASVYG